MISGEVEANLPAIMSKGNIAHKLKQQRHTESGNCSFWSEWKPKLGASADDSSTGEYGVVARNISSKREWCLDQIDRQDHGFNESDTSSHSCSRPTLVSLVENSQEDEAPGDCNELGRRRRRRHIIFSEEQPVVHCYERRLTGVDLAHLFYTDVEYQVMNSEYYLETLQDRHKHLFAALEDDSDDEGCDWF